MNFGHPVELFPIWKKSVHIEWWITPPFWLVPFPLLISEPSSPWLSHMRSAQQRLQGVARRLSERYPTSIDMRGGAFYIILHVSVSVSVNIDILYKYILYVVYTLQYNIMKILQCILKSVVQKYAEEYVAGFKTMSILICLGWWYVKLLSSTAKASKDHSTHAGPMWAGLYSTDPAPSFALDPRCG